MMKNWGRHVLIVLAAGSVALGSAVARGDDLFTFTVEHKGGVAYSRPLYFTIYMGYGWPDNAEIFRDVELTPSDVGSTFIATEHNDAEFDNAVSLLTDGVNQGWASCGFLHLDPGGGGGCHYWQERDLFGPDTLNGIDFAGYAIESFELTLDALTWDPPGGSSGGGWTDYYARATLTITGTPEPATLGMLVFGGLALLRRRKRGMCK